VLGLETSPGSGICVVASETTIDVCNGSSSVGITPYEFTKGKAQVHIGFDMVPDAGQWTLNYNGSSTNAMNFGADAAAIRAALVLADPTLSSTITVTGNYASGFNLTFVGVAGPVSLTAPANTLSNAAGVDAKFVGQVAGMTTDVTITANNPGTAGDVTLTHQNARNERQVITPVDIPNAGTYELSFDTHTTAAINYDANATAINAALSAASLGDLTASGDMLTGITIDFGGTYAAAPQALIVVFSSFLTRVTNLDISAPAVDAGGGVVTIPDSLHGFQAGDSVTLAGTINYDGTYTILAKTANTFDITATYVAETFIGSETATVVATPGVSETTVGQPDKDITTLIADWNAGHGGNTLTLSSGNGSQVPTADITLTGGIDIGGVTTTVSAGAGNIVEVQKIIFGHVPTAGSWELYYNGASTGPIVFNEIAANIQTLIEGLAPELASVTVSGNTATGFIVTFTGFAGDAALLEVSANSLSY
jgi:hypothetical protein